MKLQRPVTRQLYFYRHRWALELRPAPRRKDRLECGMPQNDNAWTPGDIVPLIEMRGYFLSCQSEGRQRPRGA
jgi:hypothetical protein